MTQTIASLPYGVAAASLGMHENHTLVNKFDALQKAGIVNAELGFGAYMSWVRDTTSNLPPSTCPESWGEGGEPDPSDQILWDALYASAADMKAFARSYGLTIVVLQPLNQFEGWPAVHERAQWSRDKAERWLPLCSKLGVEFLQVGSNNEAEANLDISKTAEDLRWLAELGASQSPPVKIAYESWCFSPNIASWEQTWEAVKSANHSNLGLCLDTAHFPLAPDYGWDPVTGKGWTESQFQDMLERIRQVPGDKIFYVELADVLTPVTPLGKGSDFDAWREKAQSPRGDRFVWAVCGRPVPLIGKDAGRSIRSKDDMGGARVVESVSAILSTGYMGPFMYEMFEAISMEDSAIDVPYVYAEACAKSARLLDSALLEK